MEEYNPLVSLEYPLPFPCQPSQYSMCPTLFNRSDNIHDSSYDNNDKNIVLEEFTNSFLSQELIIIVGTYEKNYKIFRFQ